MDNRNVLVPDRSGARVSPTAAPDIRPAVARDAWTLTQDVAHVHACPDGASFDTAKSRVAIAECKHAHVVGTRRVSAGTRAVIVGATSPPTASVTLQITESKAGTELQVGELFDVATGDLHAFWRTTA